MPARRRSPRIQGNVEPHDRIIQKYLNAPAIKPVCDVLCNAFLKKINFPGQPKPGDYYVMHDRNLPALTVKKSVKLHVKKYNVVERLGQGAYGKVYKMTNKSNNTTFACKYSKPASIWEIYILNEITKRESFLKTCDSVIGSFLGIIGPNASYILMNVAPYGTLQDVNYKVVESTDENMHEIVVMQFAKQLCEAVHFLHNLNIIHGDLKPDNLVIFREPPEYKPILRIIDFGQSIDLTLFPPNTRFTQKIAVEGFCCIQMLKGRSWRLEADIFSVAGVVFELLFHEDMHLMQNKHRDYMPTATMPDTYNVRLWNKFFESLINCDIDSPVNLMEYAIKFRNEIINNIRDYRAEIRRFNNVLDEKR